MSSTTDKVTGLTNETVGKIKQGAGKAMGSNKLQIEGKAQEAKGAAQKAIGEAKAATKDAANKAAEFRQQEILSIGSLEMRTKGSASGALRLALISIRRKYVRVPLRILHRTFTAVPV